MESQPPEPSVHEILHSSPVGISITRLRDRCIVDMNEVFLKILGFSRDEVVGRSTRELGLEVEAGQREAVLREFLEKGCYSPRPMPIRRKDGTVGTVLFSASPVTFAAEPHAIIWVMDITERLRTEEALRVSEEKWRTLAESAPVVILTVDRAGTILTFSHSLTGRAAEDVIGRCIHDFTFDEESRRRSVEHLARVFSSGRTEKFEVDTVAPDGRRVRMRNVLSPLISDGHVTTVIGVGMDVTPEAEAFESLRRTTDQLSALSSNLADGMVYQINSGRDGRRRNFTYLSPAIERFHGLSAEAVRGNPELLYDQVVEEDRGIVAEAEARAYAARSTMEVEVRVRLPSGELRWRRFTSAPRTTHDGCLFWDGIEQDITDQKHLAEQLRQSEQRFREIVAGMGDWLVECDPSWRTTYSSPQVQQLLGYTPEEMLGRSPMETAVPEERERLTAAMAEFLRGKQPIRDVEVWHLRKDGRRVCLSVSGAPILGEDGELRGMRAVVHEVTERKAFEVKMQQAQKLESLGILAGGIAHDFNNLLAAVLGNAELALAELPPAAAARESVEQIEKAALHAAELTRQMLDYAGRSGVAAQPVAIREVIRDMAQLLCSSISKRHELAIDLPGVLPTVMADPAQVRQIVMNLVMNASEAIGEHAGVVTLRAAALDPGTDVAGDFGIGDLANGRHVCLEVSDTGEGIDRQILPQIFDPFFTTKFAGRGLGLAAVLGIVRRHGGALRVRSRRGEGTSFWVLLPASEGAGPNLAGPETGPFRAWRGAGRLLLVDDEESVRSVTSRMLRAMGFEVLLAADGVEALATLEAGGIRAVLLDLTMPRMDGEATLRALRKISPDLPVVLCSGFDMMGNQKLAADLKVSGFLLKPYRLADLQRALRRALGE